MRKEKPVKEAGHKELKILPSLHTQFITNLPNCSSALLTSSPHLRMEVLFELQTGLRCIPLKTGENSYWDKLCDVYFASHQISKEKIDKKINSKSSSSTRIPWHKKWDSLGQKAVRLPYSYVCENPLDSVMI